MTSNMLFVILWTVHSILVFAASNSEKKPPNIIWIYADDLGYNDLGFRNPDVITPHLDRLAREGVILTNHYVQGVCTPSRTAFLSGRYPFKSGMQHSVVLAFNHWCLPLQFKLLPAYLKDLGYSTHALGKWHIGHCRWECTPLYRGFDSFFGGLAGAADYYQHTGAGIYDWNKDLHMDLSARGVHSQDLVLNRALDILDQANSSEPIFLYLAFHNPHSPQQPKPEFLKLYQELNASHKRKGYLGLDAAVGQIMDKLEMLDYAKNSIIIFASDNGADTGEGDNSPFRGGKGSLWEGGTKSASFVWSPLLEKTAYENDGLMHVVDWLPTLVKMAGGDLLRVADDIDGVDQSEMILRGAPSSRTHMVYNIDREYHLQISTLFGEIAVRNTKYKLLWGMPGQTDGYGLDVTFISKFPFYQNFVKERKLKKTRKKRGGPYIFPTYEQEILDIFMNNVRVTDDKLIAGKGFMQLYNLKEDPSETTNLVHSTKPADQRALAELVHFAQQQIYTGYYHVGPQYNYVTRWTGANGKLVPGWCTDTFHLPSEWQNRRLTSQ